LFLLHVASIACVKNQSRIELEGLGLFFQPSSPGAPPIDFQRLNVYKIVTSDRPRFWSRSGALALSALQRESATPENASLVQSDGKTIAQGANNESGGKAAVSAVNALRTTRSTFLTGGDAVLVSAAALE
jgi:hypothetical protein